MTPSRGSETWRMPGGLAQMPAANRSNRAASSAPSVWTKASTPSTSARRCVTAAESGVPYAASCSSTRARDSATSVRSYLREPMPRATANTTKHRTATSALRRPELAILSLMTQPVLASGRSTSRAARIAHRGSRREAWVLDESFVGQGTKKREQVFLLLAAEVQRPDDRIGVGMSLSAAWVKADNVAQRRQRAVVHVRCGERDIPERRDLELPFVLGLFGDPCPSCVRAHQPIVCEGIVGQVESDMAVEAIAPFTERDVRAALFRRVQRRGVSFEVAIVAALPAHQRPHE